MIIDPRYVISFYTFLKNKLYLALKWKTNGLWHLGMDNKQILNLKLAYFFKFNILGTEMIQVPYFLPTTNKGVNNE